MGHGIRLLVLSTLVACGEQEEEQTGDYASRGYAQMLEDRIAVLEEASASQAALIEALTTSTDEAVAGLDDRLTAAETDLSAAESMFEVAAFQFT